MNLNDAIKLEPIKQFILNNGIIGTTAGVSIGMVTNLLIQSLVGDIIVPIIIFLCLKLNLQWLTNILPSHTEFSLNKFIKQLISWILTLLISFLFVKTAFEMLLGISHKKEVKDEKKIEPFSSYFL
jgi:large-conductance mechanosensitive channel